MDPELYQSLLDIQTSLATAKEKQKNFEENCATKLELEALDKEFSNFKTRAHTIWACITTAAGVIAWLF